MAPLVRANAPKAVKDRARTLQSKAKELHDVMQHNPSLQLPGRVATLAETKPGHWDVFSSCKPEELPIDLSQMPHFDIKYLDNRTASDSTVTVAAEDITPGPSMSTQEHVGYPGTQDGMSSAIIQDYVNSPALDKTSMDIHSPSFGQTLSPQHLSVPQKSFLPPPTFRALPEQHSTTPDTHTLPIFATDSLQPTASTVPALNGPTMVCHCHSLPPTHREMSYRRASPEQHDPSFFPEDSASIPRWTNPHTMTVNSRNLATFNSMPIDYYSSRLQVDKFTPPRTILRIDDFVACTSVFGATWPFESDSFTILHGSCSPSIDCTLESICQGFGFASVGRTKSLCHCRPGRKSHLVILSHGPEC